MMALTAAALLLLIPPALANDPAGSWLSYAGYTDPAGGRITALNCSWVVPALPTKKRGSNAPGWWYGIQTAEGDGMLIQPILAYGYQGEEYSIFNGVYDWNPTPSSWWTSDVGTVQPGDVVTSSLTLVPGTGGKPDAYEMFVGVAGGFSATSTKEVDAGQSGNESWAMFVLEHQPHTCAAYPPDEQFTWENIYLEVEFEPVVEPAWVATQEQPACASQAKVVDASTITVSWDTSAVVAEFDMCCAGPCAGGLSKYYSIDTDQNMCGECCMEDSQYKLYKVFEPNLEKAAVDSPCAALGYATYDSTVTHGAPPITMTLDLYDQDAARKWN